MNEPWSQEMRDTFKAMHDAELLMDDMDIIEESPRFKAAMDAAARFHAACDRQNSKGGTR